MIARLGIAHCRPAGNLLRCAAAADTEAKLIIEKADIDARRVQESATFYESRRLM
jgi:hypothetical protein